jgi:hypothetical protein
MPSDQIAVMSMWLTVDIMAASAWVAFGSYVFGSAPSVQFVRMMNVVPFIVLTVILAANPLPRWLWSIGAHGSFMIYIAAPIVILCIAVARDWSHYFVRDFQRDMQPRVTQQSATAIERRRYQDAIDTVWGEVLDDERAPVQNGPQPRALNVARRAITRDERPSRH